MALPMKYNLNIEAERSHLDQWQDVWPDARIIHYTQSKPWWAVQCAEDTNCTFHQSTSRWFEIRDEMNSVYSDWVPLDPPRYYN
jgi:lipopolysaccharide biosynthesis glycosyltransferase